MTIPEYWTQDESDESPDDVQGMENVQRQFPVVPVKVVFDENERLSPTFCSCMTWPIPQVGVGVPLLVLPRKETRFKAKFVVNFPAAGSVYFNTKYDPLSNPSPQGFQLIAGGAVTQPSPSQPTVGASPYTYVNTNPYTVNVTVAGGTVSAIAVNGQTTGITSGTFALATGQYITVTYTVAPTTFSVANANANVAGGGNLFLPDYDSMQPMYAIATIAGCTLSVWDESFGNVAAS